MKGKMLNLIEKIREASRLSSEVDDELFKLRGDYLQFLFDYNPIGLVPEFRVMENMPVHHYEMSLRGEIKDSVYFSGEQFETVYFFRMPLDFITSPEAWLITQREKQEALRITAERKPFPCPSSVFGCNCEGDIEKHYDY